MFLNRFSWFPDHHCVLSRWFITTWSTWSEPNTNMQLQQPSQQIQAQTHQLEYGESAYHIYNSWYFTHIIHQLHKNSQVTCLAATWKWFFSLELKPFSAQWAPLLHTSFCLASGRNGLTSARSEYWRTLSTLHKYEMKTQGFACKYFRSVTTFDSFYILRPQTVSYFQLSRGCSGRKKL